MAPKQKTLPKSPQSGRAILPAISTAILASTLLLFWQRKVNSEVPDPYLDEVFHVRQAQAYWAHRWRQWDPKITTPPGVYLCSYIIGAALLVVRLRPAHTRASDLRYGNSIVLFNLLQLRLRKLLEYILKGELISGRSGGRELVGQGLFEKNMTVLNICLFPPLFFFSGLYYTDLAALLIVVEVYISDLSRGRERDAQTATKDRSISNVVSPCAVSWKDVRFVIYGLAALLFRQTNIFWVAVFLGGLQVVRTLHRSTSDCQSTDILRIARGSWELHQLYDPPVSEASFEGSMSPVQGFDLPLNFPIDYFKTLLSLGISAVSNLVPVITALSPYLFFLGAFGAFVLWNGSVVLGHKEFHTAGLHLPQMLYIWPYFIFFSWPIFAIPFAINIFQHPTTRALPSIKTAAILIPLMLVTVHLNTIVHPFTLADNRHYVFYIFRILLRHPLVKYLVTPIYFVCGWAILASFGPIYPSLQVHTLPKSPRLQEEPPRKIQKPNPRRIPDDTAPQVRLSFVLIWLIATSLSLITAPLVEPRYFIIPWVIWRLHVSPSLLVGCSDGQPGDEVCHVRLLRYLPLLVETVWLIIINAVTGYVFLYKGFEWPQEPGLVQRFMW
ncbi:glucosyltransferase [Onygenales sp. PD_40]|nr:glucosyltransferase [Onygenales sp. PD_40]